MDCDFLYCFLLFLLSMKTMTLFSLLICCILFIPMDWPTNVNCWVIFMPSYFLCRTSCHSLLGGYSKLGVGFKGGCLLPIFFWNFEFSVSGILNRKLFLLLSMITIMQLSFLFPVTDRGISKFIHGFLLSCCWLVY